MLYHDLSLMLFNNLQKHDIGNNSIYYLFFHNIYLLFFFLIKRAKLNKQTFILLSSSLIFLIFWFIMLWNFENEVDFPKIALEGHYLKYLMEVAPGLKTVGMGRFSLIRLWRVLKKVSALYMSTRGDTLTTTAAKRSPF